MPRARKIKEDYSTTTQAQPPTTRACGHTTHNCVPAPPNTAVELGSSGVSQRALFMVHRRIQARTVGFGGRADTSRYSMYSIILEYLRKYSFNLKRVGDSRQHGCSFPIYIFYRQSLSCRNTLFAQVALSKSESIFGMALPRGVILAPPLPPPTSDK